MSTRKPLIAGNWKMHKTVAETRAYIAALRDLALPLDAVDAVLCPPFTALAAAHEALDGSAVGLGAQNVNWAEQGAFTGEISAPMLAELGVTWVVIGHSERRALFGELDVRVNEKVRIALAHGITPIVAVGETADQHAAGAARDIVCAQIDAAFAGIAAAEIGRCAVAYEPIWAIGTGRADTPESANAIMGEIRRAADGLQDVRILYGGSANPTNIASFVAQPEIDGALVGGASLQAASFAALLNASAQRAAR